MFVLLKILCLYAAHWHFSIVFSYHSKNYGTLLGVISRKNSDFTLNNMLQFSYFFFSIHKIWIGTHLVRLHKLVKVFTSLHVVIKQQPNLNWQVSNYCTKNYVSEHKEPKKQIDRTKKRTSDFYFSAFRLMIEDLCLFYRNTH